MDGARRAGILATVSVLAPLAFWSAMVAGGMLRGQRYDHLTQAISELSVGENAPLMNAGSIAYGVLTVWFALGLRRDGPGVTRGGLLLLALAGAATAGLGVQWLAWDTTSGPPVAAAIDAEGLTLDGTYDLIHNALAGSAYLLGALGAITVGIGVRGQPRWAGYAPYFVATGAVVIVLALFIEATAPVLDGLIQRALVALLQLWPAVYAVRSAARRRLAAVTAPARG